MTTPDEEKKETGVQLVEQVSNDKEKSQDWIKQEIEWLQQQVESKKNSWEIKEQVENERYWKNKLLTYEILEWTSLKWTMLKIIADPIFDKNVELKDLNFEQRIEKIFRKVNIVLTKFYERKFNIEWDKEIPSYIKDVFVPATEWYLMDILKETGHDDNVNFLTEITNLKVESISSLFKGINNFSKKFSIPFSRWKALLNISDFVSLPKNQEKAKKLKNPYELYEKLFNNSIFTNTFRSTWEDAEWVVNINNISRDQFDLTDLKNPLSEEDLQKQLEKWKDEIKKNIWSIEMVDSTETVSKVLSILDKADGFMTTTKKMGDELIDSMDSFWNMAQSLNNSFWLNVRKILKNLEKKPIIWWIISFVLSLLGFSWWIWWIEKAWKKRKIDRELDSTKKDYIKEVYEEYMTNKKIESWTSKQILNQYWLRIDSKYNDKFSIDLPLIKKKIEEKITENGFLINPSTLRSVNTNNFKWSNYVEEVKNWDKKILKLKKSSFTETEIKEFTEWYIYTILNQYKKKDRLENLKDADTLAFTMIAWVTLNKDNVIDGVEAELFLPSEFYEKQNTAEDTDSDKPVEKWENLNYGENLSEAKKRVVKWELDSVKSPLTTDNIIQSSKTYNIPVEYIMAIVKNDSSYWTEWKWARTKNPWNVWNTDDWSEKTFENWQQWLDAATKVIKDRVIEYQNVYWTEEYPWITNLVENRWPDWKWFLSKQKNYKQPNEYRWDQSPYWAYMSAKEWIANVDNITKTLRDQLNNA